MRIIVLRGDDHCGRCNVTIAAGDPVCLLANDRMTRCASCAGQMGFEIDLFEVEAARRRLEQEDAARASTPVPMKTATLPTPEQLPLRVTPSADAPKPFHSLSRKERERHNAMAGNK